MKRLIIIVFFILPVLSMPAFAAGRISGGLYAGYQYDVGALNSDNSAIDLQQNLAAGAMIKIDITFLFFRTGADFSYPVEYGRTGGNVTRTRSYFIEVPAYAGFNIPVRNFGLFYMGGGGSYIFGMGNIKTKAGSVDINEQLFGYGFLSGIESEISADVSFFFEWEYMTVRSSPVASSVASGPRDYCIDYSGNRFRLGFMYHFNRY